MDIKQLNEELTKLIDSWEGTTSEVEKGKLKEYEEKLKLAFVYFEGNPTSIYSDAGTFALTLSELPKLKFDNILKKANIQLEGLSQEFMDYMNDDFRSDWPIEILSNADCIDSTTYQVIDYKKLYDMLKNDMEASMPSELNLEYLYGGEYAPKNEQEKRIANEVREKMIKYVEEPYKRNLAKLEKYLPYFD
jgi:hypothetical protein